MPQLFIFIGRSGCGKGTQAELLDQFLRQREPTRPMLRIETGKLFRELAAAPGHTSQLVRQHLDQGHRLPDFLAVWNWARIIIKDFTGEENIIIDGAPRSLVEAQLFDTLIQFYPGLQPVVVFLNIKRETAAARLQARGRSDDQDRSDIENRLDWFDREVEPALDHFRSTPAYQFLDIDGEPAVELIHQAIVSRL